MNDLTIQHFKINSVFTHEDFLYLKTIFNENYFCNSNTGSHMTSLKPGVFKPVNGGCDNALDFLVSYRVHKNFYKTLSKFNILEYEYQISIINLTNFHLSSLYSAKRAIKNKNETFGVFFTTNKDIQVQTTDKSILLSKGDLFYTSVDNVEDQLQIQNDNGQLILFFSVVWLRNHPKFPWEY